jgi:integrase
MRRGELLSIRFGGVDFDRHVIHIRPENAKSRKGREIPIVTTRLRTLLEWLRIDAGGKRKPPGAAVFSNEVGDPSSNTTRRGTRRSAGRASRTSASTTCGASSLRA